MNPLSFRLMMLLPLFALLCCAAIIDLRSRRIPNWLTISLATAGLVQTFLPAHGITLGQALLGLLAGLVLKMGLFMLRGGGGGDVKLLAAVGAWVGSLAVFEIFIVATLLAAVLALVQCLVTGKLAALLHNTGLLAVSIAHPRQLGTAHLTDADGTFRSVGRQLPYAVPVMLATLVVIAFL
jgi:prepilin peptidase CpaA